MPASLTTRTYASAATPPEPLAPSSPSRISSIDALRGLVMFAMIFVNDIAGAPHAPWWLKHYSETSESSGMTPVDLVFPAFLFIVGMSIPFGLGSRLARGEPIWRILAHVCLRTLSLLAIGILMVNSEAGPNLQRAGISKTAWAALLYAAAILAFCSLTPREHETRRRALRSTTIALRLVGAAVLIWLALVYRTDRGGRLIAFHSGWPPVTIRTQWYGILGLIGWAYLVASIVFLLFRTNRTALLACTALLMSLFIADRAGTFNTSWLRRVVSIGEVLGSQASITVAGVLLATILLTPDTPTPASRARFTTLFIGGFAFAALLFLRPYGIFKNDATPSWCLWACAITATLWLLFYFLTDVWRLSMITTPFTLAGQNVLLAYLLSDGLVPWLDLTPLGRGYDALAEFSLASAIARSAGVGIVILALTALLNRAGFRLKL